MPALGVERLSDDPKQVELTEADGGDGVIKALFLSKLYQRDIISRNATASASWLVIACEAVFAPEIRVSPILLFAPTTYNGDDIYLSAQKNSHRLAW